MVRGIDKKANEKRRGQARRCDVREFYSKSRAGRLCKKTPLPPYQQGRVSLQAACRAPRALHYELRARLVRATLTSKEHSWAFSLENEFC
jgi:hypothetical protein